METQKSQFDRNLLIVMVVLYMLTIAIFGYPMVAYRVVDDSFESSDLVYPACATLWVDLCAY